MLDNPCVRCGWKLKGFHICVIDLRTEEGVVAARSGENIPKQRKSRARRGANRSESVRIARSREVGRAERDAEIIRLYDKHNFSINEIVKKLGYDQRTVSKVVKAAAEAGSIVFRGNTGRPSRAAG